MGIIPLTPSLEKLIAKDYTPSTRYLKYMRLFLAREAHTFEQCFGNAAIGLASVNLSLRTYVTTIKRAYMRTNDISSAWQSGRGDGSSSFRSF
jgi:hypothetical protein